MPKPKLWPQAAGLRPLISRPFRTNIFSYCVFPQLFMLDDYCLAVFLWFIQNTPDSEPVKLKLTQAAGEGSTTEAEACS